MALRLTLLFYSFLSVSSAYSQLLENIIPFKGQGNQSVYGIYTDNKENHYVAYFYNAPFEVDSLGTTITVDTVSFKRYNPLLNGISKMDLAVVKFDSSWTYQYHFVISGTECIVWHEPQRIIIKFDNLNNAVYCINGYFGDSVKVFSKINSLNKTLYFYSNPDANQPEVSKSLFILKTSENGQYIWHTSIKGRYINFIGWDLIYYTRCNNLIILPNNHIVFDLNTAFLSVGGGDTITFQYHDNSTFGYTDTNSYRRIVLLPDNGKIDTSYALVNRIMLRENIGIPSINLNNYIYSAVIIHQIKNNDTLLKAPIPLIKPYQNAIKTYTVLIKYDEKGAIYWAKIIDSLLLYEVNLRIKLCADRIRNRLIFAYSADTNYIDPLNVRPNYESSINIQCFDENGTVLTQHNIRTNRSTRLTDLVYHEKSDAVIILGETNGNQLSNSGSLKLANQLYNASPFLYIIKETNKYSNGFWLNLNQFGYKQPEFFPPFPYPSVYGNEIAAYGKNKIAITGYYNNTLQSLCKTKLAIDQNEGCIIKAYIPEVIDTAYCTIYQSPSGKVFTKYNGNYWDTIRTQQNCDSIFLLRLKDLSNEFTSDTNVCHGFKTVGKNKTWYYQSAIVFDTLTNKAGCDSIVTINLTVNSPLTSIDTVVIKRYKSPSRLFDWDSTGTYYDTIKVSNGCDSIFKINLKVLQNRRYVDTTFCRQFKLNGINKWVNESGIYYDTLTNILGYDSIIIYQLKSLTTYDTLKLTHCGPLGSLSGKFTMNNTGQYKDTISNMAGCDSILIIEFIRSPFIQSLKQAACKSYVSPSGKYTWHQSGNYLDTLLNNTSCDTIYLIELTISSLTTGIEKSNDISCDSLSALITANSPYFNSWKSNLDIPNIFNKRIEVKPSETTTFYALFSDSLGCTAEDSITIMVNKTDIGFLFPNVITPNNDGYNDILSIEPVEYFKEVKLSIFNRWGNKVFETIEKPPTWNAKTETNGTYFYILKGISTCDLPVSKTGTITVIKD